MKLEEVEKLELIEECHEEKIGIIRRGFKGTKSFLRVITGKTPTPEEQERNRNTWEGRLVENHYYIAGAIIMGLLGVTVASGVYTLVTVAEYIKNIYAN